MKRRSIWTSLLLSLFLINLGAGQVMAQDIKVYPSRHGVMAGEEKKTLVALDFGKVIDENRGDLTIRFTFPQEKDLVSGMHLLLSDSLVVRDLNDYKGRVEYQVYPITGSGVATLPAEKLKGKRAVYITADLKKDQAYDPAHRLTFTLDEVLLGGKRLETQQVGLETSRQFFRIYKPLYVPGDGGSRNYRIPAILKTQEGTLLAVADRRKYNQADIPEDIDIILRRSFDGGRTWSEPNILIEGEGHSKGYGDAALVQTKSGKIIMIFIGGPGLWHSTAEKPQPHYVMTSDDNGATWSEAVDVTHFLYGHECSHPVRSQFLSSFIASGQGIQSASGRVMFVAAMRTGPEYALDNYLVYSDDEGKTWNVSELACKGGDEAKVIQLPDGSILMSVRNQRTGERIFKLSYDDGVTWSATERFAGLYDPAVNGAPLIVQIDDKPTLIHSLPIGPERRRWDGAVYKYDEATRTWSAPVLINPGMSAYSDMTLIDDETIAYFVEEDDQMSMVFITFTIDDLHSFAKLQE